MGMFVRALLIWLLVLAVPAQGAAAAIMAFCGADHHGGGSARAELNLSAAEHAHHVGAMTGDGLDAAPGAEMAGDDDTSVMVKAGQVAQKKCSACASCCALGAILGTVPLVPATDPVATVFVSVVTTVDAFAADGPDRPPRHVLV